jgi:hypothetical protein
LYAEVKIAEISQEKQIRLSDVIIRHEKIPMQSLYLVLLCSLVLYASREEREDYTHEAMNDYEIAPNSEKKKEEKKGVASRFILI